MLTKNQNRVKNTIIKCFFLVCVVNNLHAQSKIVGDSLFYQGKRYAVGDTVQLWYGSNNKNFAFVSIGTGASGFDPAPAKWSKTYIIIEKVMKQRGKNYVRGKGIDAGIAWNKFLIDIEGAVDNGEIKGQSGDKIN